MSAENQLERCQIALKLSDLDRLYEVFDMKMPRQMRVAMFFVQQFEKEDFDFQVVTDEEWLQDAYEELALIEIEAQGRAGWKEAKRLKPHRRRGRCRRGREATARPATRPANSPDRDRRPEKKAKD